MTHILRENENICPQKNIHLKEISPECSVKGLMLKLKLRYFGHLMRRTDSFEKTLMLGKIEGRRGLYVDIHRKMTKSMFTKILMSV